MSKRAEKKKERRGKVLLVRIPDQRLGGGATFQGVKDSERKQRHLTSHFFTASKSRSFSSRQNF